MTFCTLRSGLFLSSSNHTDYNNRPSNAISFMCPIASSSGILHSEFVSLYFYRIIGTLMTAFLELQEFRLRNPTTSSTTAVWRPPHRSNPESDTSLVSIFRCSSPPPNPVYTRRVDPSALTLSLSSHPATLIYYNVFYYLSLYLFIINRNLRLIRVDHTNGLQVATRTHSFISGLHVLRG